ncbi:hypothetical protein Tco_0934986 [Tanacetum coccineum]
MKKHFAAKKAEEKRNKPPTKSQKRKTMSTYLKNMDGWKLKQLKNKSDELRSESTKKQKVDDGKETAELQMLVEITLDEEEVAVDAIPLATKPPAIVDYKIYKEEKISYYHITRANGFFKLYKVFSQLLKCFDREDLETLWSSKFILLKLKVNNVKVRVTAAKLNLCLELMLLMKVTTAEELQLLQGLRVLQDKADEKITAGYDMYKIF